MLSRHNVPEHLAMLKPERRAGAVRGAYTAKEESTELDLMMIATRSEVQHALKAAEAPAKRIPGSVLPKACTRRIAIEAGVSAPWYRTRTSRRSW